jgi:hypothetical protein
MLVIEKAVFENGGAWYNISVQDSRYDNNYNTLWGRLKRAAMALFGKPVTFSDLCLSGEDTFRQLVSDMEELSQVTYTSDGESSPAPEGAHS